MPKLTCTTPKDAAPGWKPRIFFTSHPDDYGRYFERIKEEIFKFKDCEIWYDSDPNGAWDEEYMETELGEMHLIVVPVTSLLLHRENVASGRILPFAEEKHIPVLPFCEEHGIESEFCLTFPWKTCLNRNFFYRTPEHISYEQELEWHLNEALVDDDERNVLEDSSEVEVEYTGDEDSKKPSDDKALLTYKNALSCLYGTDTQIDRKKGIDLLREAVDLGVVAAMGKLASIYRYGIGVPVNRDDSISWQVKFIQSSYTVFTDYSSDETFFELLDAITDLEQEDCTQEERQIGAINCGMYEVAFYEQSGCATGPYWARRELINSYQRLAANYLREGGRKEAATYANSSIKMADELFLDETHDARDLFAIASGYDILGDIYQSQSLAGDADKFYKEAISIYEQYPEKRESLSFTCYKAGENCRKNGLNDRWEAYYERALDELWSLCENDTDVEKRVALMDMCLIAAMSHQAGGNIGEAERILEKMVPELERLRDETDSYGIISALGYVWYYLAQLSGMKSDHKEERERLLLAREQFEKIGKTYKDYDKDTVVILTRIRDILADEGE